MSDVELLRAAVQDAVGTELELADRIGQGHFGVVYRATDHNLGREVALKVLRPEFVETPLRERFVWGAKVTAQLEHPGIVRIHGVRDTPPLCWIMTPLVEGESLAGLLLREGRLAAPQATRVLAQLADALRLVHTKGIVHRDIKPQHILLDGPERDVRLIDFGLAGLVGHPIMPGYAIGTPAYRSPELAGAGGAIDGRSDLYSLGVVGYQMLTGALPFEGTAEELARAHGMDAPRDPTEHCGDIPTGLGAVVMRCLAKRPAERWGDAGEMLSALKLG